MSIAYGLEVQQENDPYLEKSEAAVSALAAAGVPGAFLVDFFPLLRHVPAWFPGASFQRKARKWRELVRDTLEAPYAAVKKDRVDNIIIFDADTYRSVDDTQESGKNNISMVSNNLQKTEEGTKDDAFTEEIIQSSAGSLFSGKNGPLDPLKAILML